MDNKEEIFEMDDEFVLQRIDTNSEEFKDLINCDIVELTHVACFDLTKEQLEKIIDFSNITDECFMHFIELEAFNHLSEKSYIKCIRELAPILEDFWDHPKIRSVINAELIAECLLNFHPKKNFKFEFLVDIFERREYFEKLEELEEMDDFNELWENSGTESEKSEN